MNFFFDRNIGVRIARMLDAFDSANKVSHQDDDNRFQEQMKDTDIIRLIASDNPAPVFITSDTSMRRRPEERAALRGSSLTVVFLKRSLANLDFHRQAVKLLKVWPEIVKATKRCKEPTAFEIGPGATKVDLICKTSAL